MGHTYAEIKIYNPTNPDKKIDIKLLVDTGSTYTWIKRKKLDEIGIKIMGRRKFRTIENNVIEREIGEAVIECLGEKATRIVVFAGEDDIEVIGIDTLEGLGLEIDPITKELRKSEALLAV